MRGFVLKKFIVVELGVRYSWWTTVGGRGARKREAAGGISTSRQNWQNVQIGMAGVSSVSLIAGAVRPLVCQGAHGGGDGEESGLR